MYFGLCTLILVVSPALRAPIKSRAKYKAPSTKHQPLDITLNPRRNEWFSNRLIRRAVFLHQLDVEAQRLKFAHQHVERFRQAGIEISFTLDDRFVNLGTAGHVVRLS